MRRIGFTILFFCGFANGAIASQSTTTLSDIDETTFSHIISFFPETLEDRVFLYANLTMTCKSLRTLVGKLPSLETYFPDYYARVVRGILQPECVPRCVIPGGYTFDPLIENLLGKAIYHAIRRFDMKNQYVYESWLRFKLPYWTRILYNLQENDDGRKSVLQLAINSNDPWLVDNMLMDEDFKKNLAQIYYLAPQESTNPDFLFFNYFDLNSQKLGKPRNEQARDIYKRGKALNYFWYYDQRFHDRLQFNGSENETQKNFSPKAIGFLYKNLPRHSGWWMEYLLKRFTKPNESLQAAKVNFLTIDGLEEEHQLRSKAQAIALICAYIYREDKEEVESFHQAAIDLIRTKKLSPFVKKSELEVFDRERQENYQKYLKSRNPNHEIEPLHPH